MKARCLAEIVFPHVDGADAAIKAVSHEGDVGDRSSVRMTKDGRTLKLEIVAEDVVALRATLNACLRAVQVFEGIEEGEYSEVQK
ncbi:MAG: KEOPS complex subunit Pcc1 [Candidatus Micrarchaeia archaeon]